MKKYEPPKAEIVVFDYTESVVACSDWGWCMKYKKGNNSKGNNGDNSGSKGVSKSGGSDVSNPHWECKSPDYWGC